MSPSQPLFQSTGRRRWTNWHEFEYPVKELIDVWNGDLDQATVEGYNATTQGFQKVIAEALRHGDEVRAAGGGWSFSAVAATQGVLLNTRPLNYRFPVRAQHAHPDYSGDATNLFFVQCGNSIAELHRYLGKKGKSLQTCGASNGQTIAGALSTGTHGSAFDVGAIPDFVQALHLIVSPDRTVWLERASRPIVRNDFARAFGVHADDILRDDEMFNAALVGLGSFGLIHGVVIEATDLFHLQCYRQLMEFNAGVQRAGEELIFTELEHPRPEERPYHFELVLNPFDVEHGVYVTVMYKDSTPATDCQPMAHSRIGPGDSATEIVGVMMDLASRLTPALTGRLLRQFFAQHAGICGTLGEIFTDTSKRGKAASCALGLPLEQVREARTLVRRQIEKDKVPIILAQRYARASAGTLAFTSHSPYTCILDIDGPRSRGVLNTYRRIWRVLQEAGINYTFHWGKMNNLHQGGARVREMYGDRAEAWLAARRRLLPTAELRRVFANDLLRKMDLAS